MRTTSQQKYLQSNLLKPPSLFSSSLCLQYFLEYLQLIGPLDCQSKNDSKCSKVCKFYDNSTQALLIQLSPEFPPPLHAIPLPVDRSFIASHSYAPLPPIQQSSVTLPMPTKNSFYFFTTFLTQNLGSHIRFPRLFHLKHACLCSRKNS